MIQTILEAQDTCSMLALALREEGGIAFAAIANVTEQVLRRAKLPILIIRSRLSEIQVQPALPKEVLLSIDESCEDGDEDEGCFAWSLPGPNIDFPARFYTC